MNDSTLTGFDIEAVYTQYAGMVYRRCLKLLQDDALAMDVMQDVFVKLIDKQSELVDNGLSSLLYQMATNLSLNHIAKIKVRSNYANENPALAEDEIDHLSDVENQVIDESELLRMLEYFESKVCEMAIYHYIDGYTLDEVAKMQNMSNSSVRRLLSQMRQSLKTLNK